MRRWMGCSFGNPLKEKLMTTKSKSPSGSRARSAVTGQYVTPQFAKANPKTTVVETNKGSTNKSKGK